MLTSQRWGHCATMMEGNVVLTGGVDFTVAGFYLSLVEIYSIEVITNTNNSGNKNKCFLNCLTKGFTRYKTQVESVQLGKTLDLNLF